MTNFANLLYLLTEFSLRSGLVEKAEIYSKAGVELFHEDQRFKESLAYCCILKNESAKARELVLKMEIKTTNRTFLDLKLAIQNNDIDRINSLLGEYYDSLYSTE